MSMRNIDREFNVEVPKTCILLFGCKKTCLMSHEKPADTHTQRHTQVCYLPKHNQTRMHSDHQ